ncbi:unnamed protein product [Albugo candida]|uniref:Uncharacterized protein n=1 Tax=Albugo candida TaxID=65357 RepID=A0A024GGL4_9STRA|nr:unnamed protein product [Albugo candida]|eukprot:CCI46022.1 unnamed protein product [Albugo candida]
MERHPFLRQFGLGFAAAIVGSGRVLRDPSVRSLLWRDAKLLLLASMSAMVLFKVVVFPFKLVISLLPLGRQMEQNLNDWMSSFLTLLPFSMLTAFRSLRFHSTEDVFFQGLALRDKQSAQRIRSIRPVRWDWEYIFHLARYIALQLALGLIMLVFSPILGALVPLVEFAHQTRRMEVMYWFPVLIGFYFETSRPVSIWIVRVWMQARAVSRELFEPIISRRKRIVKQQHQKQKKRHKRFSPGFFTCWRAVLMQPGQQAEREVVPLSEAEESPVMKCKSESARLGFAFVFSCFLGIPWIGPFVWFLGFVTAGYFAPELIHVESLLDTSSDCK